jgi:hypothetical protein
LCMEKSWFFYGRFSCAVNAWYVNGLESLINIPKSSTQHQRKMLTSFWWMAHCVDIFEDEFLWLWAAFQFPYPSVRRWKSHISWWNPNYSGKDI